LVGVESFEVFFFFTASLIGTGSYLETMLRGLNPL